ncbi:MAG: thymidine kinase [Betaproteobacteria bacterium]|nr:thymidine kinase [Betaproteobacteria bacterium]
MAKKLFFKYAAMSSGKSVALLAVAHNYEERGLSVRLFTSAFDVRSGKGTIASRIGLSREADVFDKQTVFDENSLGLGHGAILVDEAQFLTALQVEQLHRYANLQDVAVICYGLRTDFTGQPFEGSAMLLALADELEELKSICSCSRKATMNIRLGPDGERQRTGAQVQIGAVQYRSVCAACFYR